MVGLCLPCAGVVCVVLVVFDVLLVCCVKFVYSAVVCCLCRVCLFVCLFGVWFVMTCSLLLPCCAPFVYAYGLFVVHFLCLVLAF